MTDTWYVLEDGKRVHPEAVSYDEKICALIETSSGTCVRLRESGIPMTSGKAPGEEEKKEAKPSETLTLPKNTKDMKPEDKQKGYKTR